MIHVRPIESPACKLAENPLWHPDRERLYWTDIPAGKLYYAEPDARVAECFHAGEVVGGFTFNRDGTIVLFRVKDVAWIDPQGGILDTQPVAITGATRFNDVIAAPDGSVFAGTIGQTDQSGGLWHFRPDGEVRHVFAGTGCANGMAFSPDRATFYWTCSTRRQIFAYDFRDGEIIVGSARVFYDTPEEEGTPDGMTIDREGNLWSARWDGARIVKISREGKKIEEIKLPRGRVSSACFGGRDLDRLYVTAAAGKMEETISPCIYELSDLGLGIGGREEFCSALHPENKLTVQV